MIGKLVAQILEAGCNVWVGQEGRMFLLRISKVLDDDNICSVRWVISRNELAQAHEAVLLTECNQKIQLVQDEIAKKAEQVKIQRGSIE